jgi:hypothetical protein
MRGCRKAARGQPAFQQRMSFAHHRHEAIAQQCLDTDFRPDIAKDADIQIDAALTQRPDILFFLIGKA